MGGYYDPPLCAECQHLKKNDLNPTAPRDTTIIFAPTNRPQNRQQAMTNRRQGRQNPQKGVY